MCYGNYAVKGIFWQLFLALSCLSWHFIDIKDIEWHSDIESFYVFLSLYSSISTILLIFGINSKPVCFACKSVPQILVVPWLYSKCLLIMTQDCCQTDGSTFSAWNWEFTRLFYFSSLETTIISWHILGSSSIFAWGAVKFNIFSCYIWECDLESLQESLQADWRYIDDDFAVQLFQFKWLHWHPGIIPLKW